MHLNTLGPAAGSKKTARRVGRGIGSGSGKTCGRGHKGLKARSGGKVAPGFEGGQQPLQRRLPKFGFASRKSRFEAEVRLHELSAVEDSLIDLAALKKAGVVGHAVRSAKVMLSGELVRPVSIRGLRVTRGARAAIEKAGGSVEE